MISLKVIDTDEFLDMPPTTQNLYFHLCMRGDDDGFVSNPKKIMKIINSADDDFKILIGKRFIILFESGICVIKHWRIHNLIRSDRYTETEYKEEKKMLYEKDNKYILSQGIPDVIPIDNQVTPQVSLGEVSLGEVSLEKSTKIDKFSEKDISLSKLLYNLIKENDYKAFKDPNFYKWAEHIEKLHRIDEVEYNTIEFIIRWCQHDDFWKTNILSTNKLRQHFTRLFAQAKQNAKKIITPSV